MQANLDFLLVFLETSKRFVNPVKSTKCSIAGTMWAIGWRKSMIHLAIVGVYACNKAAIAKDLDAFKNHPLDAPKAGKILWKLFEPMVNIALEVKYAKFLQERGLPGFFSLPSTSSDTPLAKINQAFSSNFTFTSN
jgi:hypothetical protein